MKTILRQPFLILASILLTANLLTAQTTSWSNVVSTTTNNLYGVAYSDQNTIVAVGDLGTILRSTNGGNSWSNISSPVGDPLRAVSFNGNIGLAVGISGRILRTTNAGLTWTKLAKQTTKNLYSVSMNSKTAVITGEEGTILHSTDNGVTWSSATAGTASILFGVSAFGDSVIAAGGQGAIINSLSGGSTWGLQVSGAFVFFYGASLPNGIVGYIVGINSSSSIILRTDNTGFTYTMQDYTGTATLNGVSFTSSDTGTIVGTAGTILHTSNGGTLWETEVSGTTQSLNGVAFLNPTNGIAVGDGGTILVNVPSCAATITPSGNISICGGSLLLTANSGSGVSYQWYKNSTSISGATNQTYSAKKTAIYYVVETNTANCTAISNPVNLTVLAVPVATITPLGSLDICQTASVDLQANSGAGYLYQWKKGINNIAGATNQVYSATKKASYKVIVSNSAGCSKTSPATKVTSSCKMGFVTNQSVPETFTSYPNPSNGQFTIDIQMNDASSGFAMIEIFNTLDQIVYSAKVVIANGALQKSFDLGASLVDGIYEVEVTVSNITLSKKILIQH